MKTRHRSALAALQRDRQSVLAVALVGALAFTTATLCAQEPTTAAQSATAPTNAGGGGGDSQAELAKKLQNPIASLISVPIQNNFDFGAGPSSDGFQYLVRIQPVIPVALNENWNLISRTIIPVVYQQNYYGTSTQSGLSDTIQNLFFSPKALFHGWTWGAGPVFQFPTATESLLGSEKWCLGPTAVVLKQAHGFTYGMLMNQLTSFAGNDSRQDVNYIFLQPFFSYTTKTHTSFTANSETTYNWNASQWTVPLNFMVQQLVKIGNQPIAFQAGYRYYAQRPIYGPDWGLRFTITFLFPTKR